jgi:hypothetical protein
MKTPRKSGAVTPRWRLPAWPRRRQAAGAGGPALDFAGPPIMAPYMGDPTTRSRRRARFWLTGSVVLFCLIYGFVYAFLAPFLLPVLASPVIVLLLVLIWALPDLKHPPTGVMEGFFFATVVSLIIWPNYLAVALPGLPWITVSRLTGFPFAFLLIVCASTSTDFRAQIARASANTPWIWRLLVAFILIQFLSIALSESKSLSIQKFIINQLYWTLPFLAAVYIFVRPGRADRFAKLIWALSIPVGLIALWEYRIKHVPWVGHIPSFLQINDPQILAYLGTTSRAYTNDYRSHSTFSTPLGMAEFLSLTMPFIFHYLITSPNRNVRIAAGLSAPFLLAVIFISGSRVGVIGFGLSVIIYGLVWAVQRWRRRRGDLLAASVVFAYPLLMAGAFAASIFVGRIHKAVWGGGAQQASTQARVTQMHMGIPKIISHPLGHGVGTGGDVLGYFDPSGIQTIDSYYLLIALEYGVIGFVIYYGILAIAVYYAMRASLFEEAQEHEVTLLAPLGIALTSFLVIKSVFSNTDNHSLMFMMLGMVCALMFRMRASPASQSDRSG